jgi:hypothetical protein
MRRGRLVRGLVVLGGLAACWTIVVLWTGGGVWSLGGVRVSSRGPRNPALLTVLIVALAWAIGVAGQRTRTLAMECQWLLDRVVRRVPRIPSAPLVAGLAAVIVVIVGWTQGAWVVGGADSYGYASQSQLWTRGVLRQQPALFRSLSDVVSIDLMTPLGYRPSVDRETIAPSYPPGLPIVMAVFRVVAGSESVFWVVPIFTGVLVWATYLLGVRVHGPLVGAVAAVLVATSPPLLVQLTAAPMSDLPATAWWTLALGLATIERRIGALGAGAATGMAILTRPNLAPLLILVAGLLIWRLMSARRPHREVWQQVFLFGLSSIPACLAFGAINDALWGSALTSGHGTLSELFSPSNIWPNVVLYPRVIAQEMPIVFALPMAWWLRKRLALDGDVTVVMALGAFICGVSLAYLAYPAYDSAKNLRFLLPAIPALMVLASLAALSILATLTRTHAAACLVLMAVIGGYGVHTARKLTAFDMEHLQRFPLAGEYIKRELSQRSVVLAMLHSGSATYYSGRPTLRYDLLLPSQLDPLVDVLLQRGYEPYLLLDSDERMAFQDRFRGQSRLAALDWPPLVSLHSPSVEIYSVRAAITRRQ